VVDRDKAPILQPVDRAADLALTDARSFSDDRRVVVLAVHWAFPRCLLIGMRYLSVRVAAPVLEYCPGGLLALEYASLRQPLDVLGKVGDGVRLG